MYAIAAAPLLVAAVGYMDEGLKKTSRCIGIKWPMTQMAEGHLGQSQIANDGQLRPVMPPGLKHLPLSTH